MTTKQHHELQSFCGMVLLSSGATATLDTVVYHTDGTGETWLTLDGSAHSLDTIECATHYIKQVLSVCEVNRLKPVRLVAEDGRLHVVIPHTMPNTGSVWVVLDKDGRAIEEHQSRHEAEFTASQILGWSVEERAPCDFCGEGTQYLCPDCYGSTQ